MEAKFHGCLDASRLIVCISCGATPELHPRRRFVSDGKTHHCSTCIIRSLGLLLSLPEAVLDKMFEDAKNDCPL
jgi:hypothetical protein